MSFTTKQNKILNIFYTYVISINGIPEYVGKGKGPRCYHHFEGKNHFANHLRKAQRENKNIHIEKIIENITEEEAFIKEKELIAIYGRRDLNNGTLFNKTNGGDGVSGKVYSEEERKILSDSGKKAYANRDPKIEKGRREKISKGLKGKKLSEQTCENISKAKKGIIISQETRDKISAARKGHSTSQETRDKISKANKGREFSKEHREKIGLKSRGRIQPESHREAARKQVGALHGRSKCWRLRGPDGKEYFPIMHMSKFCEDHNLAYSALRERAQTKNQSAVKSGLSKGWIVVSCKKRELSAEARTDLDFSRA